MQGDYDYGDGRKKEDPNYMIFSKRNCNYPQPKYAMWWLTQFRRWGMVEGAPDYEGVAKQVMRTDIYEEAMKEIGYTHGGLDDKPETLFDGVDVRPDEARGVRQGVPGQQPEGLKPVVHEPHTNTDTLSTLGSRCILAGCIAMVCRARALGHHPAPPGRRTCPRPCKTWEASQALHPRAVREARRARSGHPALHLVLAGPASPRVTPSRS